ncbi:hypothetical protein CDL15_Pgr019828 [Punica granatum]|uniref:40S ribosomal protein S27 n=1 Tax=Punica granatum TaxID=22663 RepID=A0A218X702_PUNGR|nr:hypothetical protein CDL15_Pgr019828 [Punica granatum]
MVLQNDVDLLNPPAELEKRKHKLKRLVQSPNSFFMDVKCQGCFNITTVFSHSQTVVVCGNCQTVLCQPTGGRARLTEGCSFRRKGIKMSMSMNCLRPVYLKTGFVLRNQSSAETVVTYEGQPWSNNWFSNIRGIRMESDDASSGTRTLAVEV